MSIETAKIVFNIADVTGTTGCDTSVFVRMNEPHAWYGSNLIAKQRERFFPNENGSVIMNLIETSTLTDSTGTEIFYTLSVPSMKFKKKFTQS